MPTRIVVAGGGAAGLELVRGLVKSFKKTDYEVILVDQNRTHIWNPLLHEVATGVLDANIDEVSYLTHASRWGYRYYNGTLQSIDRQSREITLAPQVGDLGEVAVREQTILFDYLVLAIGSVTNDLGTAGVEKHCFFLDSRQQAERFRELLLDNCLRVSPSNIADEDMNSTVSVAIVGAGATGVELAAELTNAASALERNGLPGFDAAKMRVTIIEMGPRILPALSERLAAAAHAELEVLGIKVLTGTRVLEATDNGIATADGGLVEADIRVWGRWCQGKQYPGTRR